MHFISTSAVALQLVRQEIHHFSMVSPFIQGNVTKNIVEDKEEKMRI